MSLKTLLVRDLRDAVARDATPDELAEIIARCQRKIAMRGGDDVVLQPGELNALVYGAPAAARIDGGNLPPCPVCKPWNWMRRTLAKLFRRPPPPGAALPPVAPMTHEAMGIRQ